MDVFLSDNMKRWLCRAAFCLLCVVPTILTLRMVLLPVSLSEWSNRISQRLGTAAIVMQVDLRTPQRTDFSKIVIGGDSFESRLDIDSVVMQNLADARVLQLGTVTGSAKALRLALQRVDQQFEQTLRSDRPLLVRANRVILKCDDSLHGRLCELVNVTIRIERPGDQLQIRFSNPSTGQKESEVLINRIADTLQTTWQVDGTGGSLPGWLIREFCPGMNFIGEDAQVSGRAILYQRDSGWSGELADVAIDNLNLDDVVHRQFGQPISGRARVVVNTAALVDGRLREVKGTLHSQNGTIGSCLLTACQNFAAMQVVEPYETAGEINYRDLCFEFQLQKYSLSIVAPDNWDGAILTAANGGKVLIAKQGQPIPMVNLLSILTWPNNDGPPINRNTSSLAARLAWPPPPFSGSEFNITHEQTAAEHEIGTSFLR